MESPPTANLAQRPARNVGLENTAQKKVSNASHVQQVCTKTTRALQRAKNAKVANSQTTRKQHAKIQATLSLRIVI